MRSKRIWLGLAAGMLIAFGAGWLGAEIRNAYKLSPAEVVARRWMSGVLMLARHARTDDLIDPAKVPLIVGEGLDGDSVLLALLYDRLPQSEKERLVQFTPAARSIAAAQGGNDFLHDRRHLLILVECMQDVQSRGGSVRECAKEKGMAATEGSGSKEATAHKLAMAVDHRK